MWERRRAVAWRAYVRRERPYSDEQIDAAIDAISDPEAFGEAERQVARAAPRLQMSWPRPSAPAAGSASRTRRRC